MRGAVVFRAEYRMPDSSSENTGNEFSDFQNRIQRDFPSFTTE
jgi:hypothetical protein